MGGNRTEAIAKWTESGKNVFGLLRDLLLFLLLLMLFVAPGFINDRLLKTGISSLEGLGVKWAREGAKENLETFADLERVQAAAAKSIEQIDAIAEANPTLARQLGEVKTILGSATDTLRETEKRVATTVNRQQEIIANASPVVAPPQTGWISTNAGLATIQGERKPGSKVKVGVRPLRVRSEPNSSSSVLTILAPGAEAQVEEFGDGPWVKVRH